AVIRSASRARPGGRAQTRASAPQTSDHLVATMLLCRWHPAVDCQFGLVATRPATAHHLKIPVCPNEYLPGWGYTHNPCGPSPTGMRASRCPSFVSIAYTSESYRPDSHSTFPSAETPPISGLPPPGKRHVVTTFFVAKSSSDTLPSPRFDTYKYFESRLVYNPCAPRPVGMKPIFLNFAASIRWTPPAYISAT